MGRIVLIAAALMAALAVACGDGQEASPQPQGSTPQAGQLQAQGRNLTMIVSPAEGSTLRGTVQITVPRVPEGTVSVWFALVPEGSDIGDTGPNLGKGSQGDKGWAFSFDTTSQADGRYSLFALAYDVAEAGQGVHPLDGAQVEVVIDNGLAR